MKKNHTNPTQPLRINGENPHTNEPLKQCNHCGMLLPLNEFYRIASGQRIDSYCKACRRSVNDEHRRLKLSANNHTHTGKSQHMIVDTANRSERIQLILKAKQEVIRRMREARARRDREEESRDEKSEPVANENSLPI